MNSVEALLVDLVRLAEAPLYSAYRWLGRQLGRQVTLAAFLDLVNDLVARDVLRLWEVDHQSHDRTELFGAPRGLADRYMTEEGLDERFDPFGLSLTLGAAADVVSDPAWEVAFDFERGSFELTAEQGTDDDAIKQASSYFPDLGLIPESRESRGSRIRVTGRIEAA